MNAEVECIAAVLQRDSIASPMSSRSAPARARPQPLHTRLRLALQGWWQRLWMDERTAYLSAATSHADLEYRIRAWNDNQRHGRLPFV